MAAMGGSSSSAASCGACKFLRRKCSGGCIFAPYFSYEQGAAHFAAVHKVFGASNASKLLLQLPAHHRADAALTIAFEAQARMCDPVYGCVAYIFALQQQAARLQEEIDCLTVQLSTSTAVEAPDPQALLSSFLRQTTPLLLQDYCDKIQYIDPNSICLDMISNGPLESPSTYSQGLQEVLPEHHQWETMEDLEHCSILLQENWNLPVNF